MTIMALDDEPMMLEMLTETIKEAMPYTEIRSFDDSEKALAEIQNGNLQPEIVFMDIEMPGLSGMELAKRIKEISSKTNIVFVTGYSHYALEALALHSSGYILKPVTVEKIQKEIENLRYPIELETSARVKVQTFGNFEVIVDGNILQFSRRRAKEVFAYAVHKCGAFCSLQEIAAVLYEDEPFGIQQKGRLRQLILSLMQAFREAGCEEVIIKEHDGLRVMPDLIDCDFYRLRNGDLDAIKLYCGEYMAQYEWALYVTGYLDSYLEKKES